MRSLFDARGPLGVPRASRADVYRRDEVVSADSVPDRSI